MLLVARLDGNESGVVGTIPGIDVSAECCLIVGGSRYVREHLTTRGTDVVWGIWVIGIRLQCPQVGSWGMLKDVFEISQEHREDRCRDI